MRPTKLALAAPRPSKRRRVNMVVPPRLKRMDQRTQDAKFLKRMYEQLCDDLGGIEQLSIQQRALAEEAAWLAARLRRLKVEAVLSGKHNDPAYSATLNSFIGLLRTLGIERKAKRVLTLAQTIEAETTRK